MELDRQAERPRAPEDPRDLRRASKAIPSQNPSTASASPSAWAASSAGRQTSSM
jgi:hypothetical protein